MSGRAYFFFVLVQLWRCLVQFRGCVRQGFEGLFCGDGVQGRFLFRDSFLVRVVSCSAWDGGDGLVRVKFRGLVLFDLRMAEDLGRGQAGGGEVFSYVQRGLWLCQMVQFFSLNNGFYQGVLRRVGFFIFLFGIVIRRWSFSIFLGVFLGLRFLLGLLLVYRIFCELQERYFFFGLFIFIC